MPQPILSPDHQAHMPAQPTGELQTLLTTAAFAPIERGFLRITGADATRWLNGMVTNSIQALQPGEGSYNFLLNAQGRIQGDATIYREPGTGEPAFLLETDADQLETIQQLLDRFIIMDDVELEPLSSRSTIVLLGRTSPVTIGNLQTGAYLGDHDPTPAPLHLTYPYSEWQLTTPTPSIIPRFHFTLSSGPQADAFAAALALAGAIKISSAALETLRILEARPSYGTDIRNTDIAKDLPQETNQPQALHFAKGCYVGQEIVERIRSRGQVHRLLTPLTLTGPPASMPAPLEAGGKPAGEVTSATCVQTTEGGRWIGMGYLRREALTLGANFCYSGGEVHVRQSGMIS